MFYIIWIIYIFKIWFLVLRVVYFLCNAIGCIDFF